VLVVTDPNLRTNALVPVIVIWNVDIEYVHVKVIVPDAVLSAEAIAVAKVDAE